MKKINLKIVTSCGVVRDYAELYYINFSPLLSVVS